MKPRLKKTYYSTGEIESKEWLLKGLYHNESGPSWIWYYKNGQIREQGWSLNGSLHNENGPSIIQYYKNGEIEYQCWHLNDKEYTKKKFKRYKLIKELAGVI